MAIYYINSYDIDDTAVFSGYAPIVRELLKKYDAVTLAADTHGISLEGHARQMNSIIRFPSKEAAIACYNDPDYQPAKKIRQASTSHCNMVIVDEFIPKG